MNVSLPANVSSETSSPMLRRLLCLSCVLFFAGCIHVKVDPVHATVDVNVNVKVDKALDDFFGDLDKKSTTLSKPSAAKP
jgi:hypothetical protein